MILIILGRSLLITCGAIIDIKNGKISLNVGNNRVTFSASQSANQVDNTRQACNINSTKNKKEEPKGYEKEGEMEADQSPVALLILHEVSIPGRTAIILDTLATYLKPDLKTLPENLRYKFLGPDKTYPVIIGAHLDAVQVSKLVAMLKKHKKAIGYSIDDIKGLSPFICMHRILFEDDHKPTRETQRRLNPNMKEVVKKRSSQAS